MHRITASSGYLAASSTTTALMEFPISIAHQKLSEYFPQQKFLLAVNILVIARNFISHQM